MSFGIMRLRKSERHRGPRRYPITAPNTQDAHVTMKSPMNVAKTVAPAVSTRLTLAIPKAPPLADVGSICSPQSAESVIPGVP